MQYSANNKLKLVEGTDNVKRQDFVDNFEIIDNGLSKFYVATLNSANVYKVVTGNSLTSLNNGYSIRVAIPSNSTGAVSIIVDSVTVPVKKPNGNAVTNFKANGVYTLSYYNSVFTLASGGVDDVNFSAGDLLTGKNANNSDGEKVNGTMANNGAVTSTLTAGTSYTIPAGYHNGSGKITANSLASQTQATAGTLQIVPPYTAYVNGQKITGTMNVLQTVGSNHANAGGVEYGAHTSGDSTPYLYLSMPQWTYTSTNAWLRYPATAVANKIGLTADKIVSGNNIMGINGTATVQSMGGLQLWSTNITTIPFVQDGFNGYYFAKHKVTLPFMPKQILLKVNTTKTTKYFSYLTSIYNLGTINNTLNLTNYNSSSGVNRISAYMSGLDLNIEVGNTGGAVGTIALIELIVIG